MNKSSLSVAGGLVVAAMFVVTASGASADVNGVFTARDVNANVPGGPSFAGPVANAHTQLTNLLGGLTAPYANYQLASKITSTDIEFYNNATAVGLRSSVTASNQLLVTYTNTGSAAVVPTLNSTITPGGFGIYTIDPTQNPTFSSGKVTMGDVNQSPEYSANPNSFQGFSPIDTSMPIAGASFTFNIASNGVVLYSFNGSLTLNPNPADPAAPIVAVTLSALGATLNNFRQVTTVGDENAVGYQWDATDISVALGGLLAPGDSRTLTYSTSVTAFDNATFNSNSPCTGSCVLTDFAGFGDPIGKGNPSGAKFGSMGGGDNFTGLTFFGYSLGLPTFDSATGDLSVPVAKDPLPSLPLTYTPVTVPEPATWALMLTGFGLVGMACRRRAGLRPA
jgi:hypothetical protein